MNAYAPKTIEETAIVKTLQPYLAGARSGKGDEMKPSFHEDATIFGYVGEDLFAGPIANLFAWNDENGPATGLKVDIARIDVEGTAATVRIELDDWTGLKFTDFFTLLKVDGEWKAMNKVFHTHS